MNDELSKRQAAIRMRLAGESVEEICHTLHRARSWLQKWWQRYLDLGPEGLYDLSRANQRVVNRTPPYLERAVISIRRRLAARATPQTRYSLIGAAQIRAELEVLGYSPLPGLRTIERIIARAGLSCPPLRLSRRLARTEYPGPKALDSNQLHQVDVVGPRYLKGDSTRYYILVLRDVFDLAVYMELVTSRQMDGILAFLSHAWQQLGLPQQVQFDPVQDTLDCATGASSVALVPTHAFSVGLSVCACDWASSRSSYPKASRNTTARSSSSMAGSNPCYSTVPTVVRATCGANYDA